MRILLANYRYFLSGGPERYLFSLSEVLSLRSHTVIPFSINYSANRPTPYARYFVEPLASREEVYFSDHRWTARSLGRTMARLFYAADVEKAVTRLTRDTKPDIAYVLHYLRKLSPALLVGLKRAGLPVVVRLSDYAMVCPGSHCLRGGVPCELCVTGNLWPSIGHRCVRGSLVVSALNAMATWYHRWRSLFDLVDMFVVPTQFMGNMVIDAGVSEDRVRVLPTFVDDGVFSPQPGTTKKDWIAFVGRLEQIKGVHILIEACSRIRRERPEVSFRLKVAGSGNADYIAALRRTVSEEGLGDYVDFLGQLDTAGIRSLLSQSRISIVPSIWYENLPNAVLESYACGTPVLASNLGTMQECVADGGTGRLFRPGDSAHLAEHIVVCMVNRDLTEEMSRNALLAARTAYSPAQHVSALEELFATLSTTASIN